MSDSDCSFVSCFCGNNNDDEDYDIKQFVSFMQSVRLQYSSNTS
jgi:hypothetical protein